MKVSVLQELAFSPSQIKQILKGDDATKTSKTLGCSSYNSYNGNTCPPFILNSTQKLHCLIGTAGILAVAASKPTVLVDEQGRLYVAKQMKVNLTADHRIIYGAAAAEFMQTLKAVIEDPDQLTF